MEKCINKILVDNREIFELRDLVNKVLNLRSLISNLFSGIEVSVAVGGSFALKYWSDKFANRPVHDYDIIVIGEKDSEISKARQRLETLANLRFISHRGAYNKDAYHFEYDGLKVDILLEKGEICSELIQNPEKVIKAKKKYIREALIQNKPVREKDTADLTTFYDELDLDELDLEL